MTDNQSMPVRDDTVYFYLVEEAPYGVFSNFSPHPITVDDVRWPTSEHYFQAQKFAHSPDDMEAVRRSTTPGIAAKKGRDRGRPLRADWEEVKDDAMRVALYAKFTQHPALKQLLLATGDRDIVERTTYDYYWGCGTKGWGKNMLGVLLVELRQRLRAEDAAA